MANLEAEKDEIAMIPDKGGIPSTFIIGGKRHHSGGTPLFLPSDSFIFSDTAKMRIKDPTILAQFGMPPKKGGYTPAEIAKKYDTSKYKKILADPNTDDLQRETAELMIANNNLKLAKLAIYQESMKGFPQGMPQVGMPYLEEMGVDPAQFVQENPGQGDDETAEADNMSRFGGPHYIGGGSTKFNEFSPNAGAADAYQGVEGVEGVEGKGPTGNYQDWELIKKKKAGISGIAKAEGILAGLRGAQAFGNAREMQALDQRMQEGSLYDNAVNPIQQDATGRQGSFVQTGMATGTKDPYNTGNLVQQPGMNYAISKFGGDIDYFAPGGYLPRAQAGIKVPGFKEDAMFGTSPYEFSKKYPDYYNQFQSAFALPNTEENIATKKRVADFLQSRDVPGLGIFPRTNQDILENMAGILRNDKDILSGSGYSSEAQQSFKQDAGAKDKQNSLYAQKLLVKALKKRDEASKKNPTSEEALMYQNAVDELYELQPSWVQDRPEEDAVRDPDSGTLVAPVKLYGAKRLTKLNDINNMLSGKVSMPAVTDQSAIAGNIGKQADSSSTAAPATTVTTTADAEALKQKEALLKGTGQKSTETQSSTGQPTRKKYSNVEETDEDFKEGGSTGKRRVLIHSLGEYRMGGALKTYEDGGKTTEAKGKGIWQHSTKSGNWRLKYPDGTYGPVQKETPVLVTPYTGADAPSKYTEEEWQEFAKETGFVPQSADPKEQNREFQDHLAKHKDWGPKVDELHKKYGQPKGGKFDALLGKRWDAIVDQRAPKKGVSATPPVKDDKKDTTPTDNNIYAEGLRQPRVPNVPARFTLQDTLKGANLMADYLGIKGSQPWSAKAPVYTPDTAFVSPERQYQKIGEQFSIAAQNLAQSGDPRQYNARLGQLQGQALAAIADTAARTEGENVRIQNVQAAQNANLLNEYGQREAARRTKDYENYVTARDTVDNQKKFARNAGVNQLANAFTNRANIYNVNQLYPQYALDPTGMMYFKNPRAIKPDYTQQKTVNDYFNQILEKNENLRNEKGMVIAYDMAKNMAGVKPKTDETDEWLKASKGIIPSYNVNPYGYNNGQGT
jgi:hypothetical protein